MSPHETPYDVERRNADAAEYTGDHRHRHRERAGHVSSQRLRRFYFSVAAAWGFIVGACGLLVTAQLHGQVIRPRFAELLYLLPAFAIAVGGSVVIAGAYQESKRRRR